MQVVVLGGNNKHNKIQTKKDIEKFWNLHKVIKQEFEVTQVDR